MFANTLLIVHYIKIPVGQRCIYIKLTVPKIAWKVPENNIKTLEAADWLTDIILMS